MLGQFVETLTNAIGVERQARLDAECVDQQRKKVDALRKSASRDASREFYWRQGLMQQVERWHDAQRIRAYLAAVKAAADDGRLQPTEPKQFGEWFEWATRFADSIGPIVNGLLPEGNPPARQNVAVTNLDLTAATGAVIDALAVEDTDALWMKNQEAVCAMCQGRYGAVWNEMSRVLEGLGYDTFKREQAGEWW